MLRYDGSTGAYIDAFVPADSGGLRGPVGLLFGPDENLYVSSGGTSKILRYDGAAGAFIDEFVESASGPSGLIFGPDGNLYVNSSGNVSHPHEVRRYNGTSGTFLDVFASEPGLAQPYGVAFGPDDNLYVINLATYDVLRFDGATGTFIDAFVPPGSGLSTLGGLVFGPDNNLYVSDWVADKVLRFDGTTGTFIDIFVPSWSINFPRDLVFGPDDNLYVGSISDGVLRFDGTSGAIIGTFVPPGSGGTSFPNAIGFGPDGDFYIASHRLAGGNFSDGQVLRYNGVTGAFIDAFVPLGVGGLRDPQDFVFGADGHLYAASHPSEVLRYEGIGTLVTRYVATTGSDTGNNCLNMLSPCATLTHAVNQANPGNTINLAAGTYTVPGLVIDEALHIEGQGVIVQ